jgi:hypothetical protein
MFLVQLPERSASHYRRSSVRQVLTLATNIPAAESLSVPRNMKLLAVPLFELYDNSARCAAVPRPPSSAAWLITLLASWPRSYGPQLSAIPHLLSRCVSGLVRERRCCPSLTSEMDRLSPTSYRFIYQ